MFGMVRDIIDDLGDENEKLKKKLKEVTEAMLILADIAECGKDKDVSWAVLAEGARKLYEETK